MSARHTGGLVAAGYCTAGVYDRGCARCETRAAKRLARARMEQRARQRRAEVAGMDTHCGCKDHAAHRYAARGSPYAGDRIVRECRIGPPLDGESMPTATWTYRRLTKRQRGKKARRQRADARRGT